LQIAVNARPDGGNAHDGDLIRGDITVKNVGNKRTLLRLIDGPLYVAKVKSIPTGAKPDTVVSNHGNQVPDDGKICFEDAKKFWLARPKVDEKKRPDFENFDQVRPGATDVFPFIVRVSEPGTYGILFSPGAPVESWDIPQLEYGARWEPPTVYVDVK
jgi:hypothetical protein